MDNLVTQIRRLLHYFYTLHVTTSINGHGDTKNIKCFRLIPCYYACAVNLQTLNLLHLLFHLLQACNPRHAEYEKTGPICASEHINDMLTRYRWLVSAPTGPDGVTSPMREVDIETFFTSSKIITLDSIYFQAGSRVQCTARAVNSNGDEGLELSSPIVSISMEEGQTICKLSDYFNTLLWSQSNIQL